jgi:O-antigen/teichoic acid export membrane protein
MTNMDIDSALVGRLSKQFARNVFVGYALYLFRFAPLVLLSTAVRVLGNEQVGIWVIINSLLGYANLLDSGIHNSVVKFVAEKYVKEEEDQNELNSLVSTFLGMYCVIGGVVLVGVLFLVQFFYEIFRIPAPMVEQGNLALLVAGIGLALSFPLSVFSGVLCGLQRYDLFHISVAISALISSVLGVVLLLVGVGMVSLAIAYVVSGLVLNVISMAAVRREVPQLRLAGRFFNLCMLRHVIEYSLHIFVITIAVQISYRSYALVIGLFLDKGSVTQYEIALRLNDLIRSIPYRLVNPLLSAASSLHGSGNQRALHRLLTRTTRYALELIMPFCVVGIVLGDPLIRIWMGQEYAMSSAVLLLLLIATLASTAQSPAAVIVQGMGQPGAISWVGVLDSLANLGMSILLVRPLGLIGVALGTLVPIVLSNLLLVIPIVCRKVGLGVGKFVRNALLLPTLLGVIGMCALFLLEAVLPAVNLSRLIIVVLVFGITYLAGWISTRDRDERRLVEHQLRLVLVRFGLR